MPVMDEFKKEREAMKNGTPKQKLAYFWDYYKWHVIIGVIVLVTAVSFIYQAVTRKSVALYALLLNAAEYNFMEDNSKNTAAFAEYAGIDENKFDIMYDTSVQLGTVDDYTSAQKLMVYIAAAELDVMVSDSDSLTKYAYQGNFHDLRQILTEEQLSAYQDFFYYIDGAVVDEISAASKDGNYDFVPEYADPRRPEDMENPVPAGLFLQENSPLLQDYSFRNDQVVVSVLINTERPEQALNFVDFLMQGE
ncbi:MAG: hypothetical protein OSJ69_02550 [Acetatifactor sp.]|nr:hypothetical protein [Acetatifactor sp.]